MIPRVAGRDRKGRKMSETEERSNVSEGVVRNSQAFCSW